VVDSSREEKLLFAKHLERAQGWLLLENFRESARSLRNIPPAFRRHPDVAIVRAQLYMALKDWKRAEPVLRKVLKDDVGDPERWVNLAFAVRRAKSIAQAELILREARLRFPEVAVICFNLACYAAQQGRIVEVSELLREAIRLDPHFEEPAKSDPDLAPYWEAERATS